MGSTVLLKDEFTKQSRVWAGPQGWKDQSFVIGGGKMQAKVAPEHIGIIWYQGNFFPEADFCADIVLPDDSDTSNKWAGIAFQGPDGVYILALGFDGTVGVYKANAAGWLQPIPPDQFDAVKTDPGATNTLRLVWKPNTTSVTAYVNGKELDSFDAPSNLNRILGFAIQTGGSTVTFSKLSVTK